MRFAGTAHQNGRPPYFFLLQVHLQLAHAVPQLLGLLLHKLDVEVRELPRDAFGGFAERGEGLFQIVDFAVVFEDEHVVFFGDGFDGPFGFVGLFIAGADGFEELGESGDVLLVEFV